MMKSLKVFTNFAFVLFILFFFTGCGTSSKTAGLNSVNKTSELAPGMTYDQVVELLGKPKSSQMINGQWVARWKLQEMWKGYVPYDMVFDPDTKTLISWSANEEDFQKSQEKLQILSDVVAESAASSGVATATGPNDPELMKQFAGVYYSFSASGLGMTGGSERRITFCPNGKYFSSSESGYSGEGWGNASQGGIHGTWRITGNMNEGTITTVDSEGNAYNYNYSRCGSDCVYLGSTKYAVEGQANCQ